MIYYVQMKTWARPLRRFRFVARPPRGSRQITLSLNTLSLVPDPLGVDNMDKKDKIALMLDSIVGSCGEICKGKANLEDFVNNYMVNFFEECAK